MVTKNENMQVFAWGSGGEALLGKPEGQDENERFPRKMDGLKGSGLSISFGGQHAGLSPTMFLSFGVLLSNAVGYEWPRLPLVSFVYSHAPFSVRASCSLLCLNRRRECHTGQMG